MKAGRGFSLFEMAVAVAVFAILAGVLANRLLFYQQQAEVVAAEQLVGTLRVALQLKSAQLFIGHRERELSGLVDENPIGWLSEKPKNYLGEYYSPDLRKLPEGNWFYDRADKTLIYLLDNSKNFASGPLKLLKFKVKLARLPANPAKPSGSPALIEGAVLEQILDQAAVTDVDRR